MLASTPLARALVGVGTAGALAPTRTARPVVVTVRPSSLDSPGWSGGVTVTTAAQLTAASNVVS